MLRIVVAVASGFAISQFATLVTSVYLHRALSHRAITLRPGAVAVLRALTWITTGIRPRQWVAVHRKHHAHTDVEGDPHSPVLEGFAAVQFGNVFFYRRVAKDPVAVRRYARDLPADRWDRVLFDHALPGLAIGTSLLCLVLGLWAGLLAAGVHVVSYLLLNAAVNAVGHTYGRQPHANLARNTRWLALVTSGEGWHNNHHAFPTSARLGTEPRQTDPGWWVIRALERSNLADVRHPDTAPKERLAA